MKKRTYQSLSKEEKEILVGMVNKGISALKIGKSFGVASATITQWYRWILQNKKIAAKCQKPQSKKPIPRNNANASYSKSFTQNPNPPTATTRMLICHYYTEDVTRYKLNHAQALSDISIELGRTKSYISRVLREEQRSGMIAPEALKIYTLVMKPIGMKPLSKQ